MLDIAESKMFFGISNPSTPPSVATSNTIKGMPKFEQPRFEPLAPPLPKIPAKRKIPDSDSDSQNNKKLAT